MGRKRLKEPKPKPRKAVAVKLIEREHAGKITAAYKLLDQLVAKTHKHLAEGKFAFAWRFGWKADSDGRIKMASVKKGSDLDRELNGFDFVILINHEVWNSGAFKTDQMIALIDHQLCHCQVSIDSSGEKKTDDQDRIVYRLRKHDIEEFRDVVARHGCYTDDLQEFFESIKNNLPLFPEDDDKPAKRTGKSEVGNQKSEEGREVADPGAPTSDAAAEGKPAKRKRAARGTGPSGSEILKMGEAHLNGHGATNGSSNGTNGAAHGTNGHANGVNRIEKHLAGGKGDQ